MTNAPELNFWVAAFKIIFGFVLLIGGHEFGHAICAWLCGVKIKKFSIGIGPGFTFKNVPMVNTLVISPIAIGGLVEMDNEALENKSFWQRILVYSGGMFANVLMAIVLFMMAGASLLKAITISFVIWIAGIPLTIHAISSGAAKTSETVSGPVGIGHMMISGQFPYWFVLALISVSLAAFNLVPLPPLDGGHILRVCLEKIIGKKWSMRVWTGLLYICLPALIVLAIYTVGNDITNIIRPK